MLKVFCYLLRWCCIWGLNALSLAVTSNAFHFQSQRAFVEVWSIFNRLSHSSRTSLAIKDFWRYARCRDGVSSHRWSWLECHWSSRAVLRGRWWCFRSAIFTSIVNRLLAGQKGVTKSRWSLFVSKIFYNPRDRSSDCWRTTGRYA